MGMKSHGSRSRLTLPAHAARLTNGIGQITFSKVDRSDVLDRSLLRQVVSSDGIPCPIFRRIKCSDTSDWLVWHKVGRSDTSDHRFSCQAAPSNAICSTIRHPVVRSGTPDRRTRYVVERSHETECPVLRRYCPIIRHIVMRLAMPGCTNVLYSEVEHCGLVCSCWKKTP